ncbi:MAG: molybdopterin-guanine dinucleotide biosynthesis protein B [Myxococcota bacterium]
MKVIHIVGRKNSGKTTLLVELIKELTLRGIKVATLKHSRHSHTLDTPDKDSFRHREAGANPAAIVTAGTAGVFFKISEEEEPVNALLPLFSGCDILLVEGYINGAGEKIEVYRSEISQTPLATERGDIVALITDEKIATTLDVIPRKEISAIADYVCNLAGINR